MSGCLFGAAALLPAQPADTAGATESTAGSAVYEAMGYALAAQVRLNIGFTDEELKSIFAGMQRFAEEAEPPPGFDESIQEAQQIFFERFQAYNQIEQERLQQEAAATREQREAQSAVNRAAGEEFLTELAGLPNVEQTESGLHYEVVEPGEGRRPSIGDSVRVNYRGTRIDGSEFDSGEGVTFPLPAQGGLIDGFKEGLQLVNEGGSIKLYIPADLAYGDSAPPGGPIQPGDTLIFEVDVLEIMQAPARRPGNRPDYQPTPPPDAPPSSSPPSTPPPPPAGNAG